MLRSKFRMAKGSWWMSLYVFGGLITIDISYLRTIVGLIAACVFLALCSKDLKSDEHESESWRWSPATARAILAMIVLCIGTIVPFGVRWLRQPPTEQEAVQDGISLVGYLLFAFLMGTVVYLLLLLRPTHGPKDSEMELEALKLEHQSCLIIFQTSATGMVVIFLGALLTPILSASTGGRGLIIERLG